MVLGFTKTIINEEGRTVKTHFVDKIKKGIKLHTVREDVNSRWKPSRKIHFATGVRSGHYNCFKEGICASVQDIKIYNGYIFIDDRLLDDAELEYFANNDGFDTLEAFWDWFRPLQPYNGKIIHWTDLRY